MEVSQGVDEQLDLRDQVDMPNKTGSEDIRRLQDKLDIEVEDVLDFDWIGQWERTIHKSGRRLITIGGRELSNKLSKVKELDLWVIRLYPPLPEHDTIRELYNTGYLLGVEWLDSSLEGFLELSRYFHFVTLLNPDEGIISKIRDLGLRLTLRVSTFSELQKALALSPDIVDVYLMGLEGKLFIKDIIRRFPDLTLMISGMTRPELLSEFNSKVLMVDLSSFYGF